MKVFQDPQTREEYFATQIARSVDKFRFCKVSIHDVIKYRQILQDQQASRGRRTGLGPILCLGTRNGREVDLFRAHFFGSVLQRHAVRLLEYSGSNAFASRLPQAEAIGRSRLERITPESVIGVELNPQAARQDVRVGSFDELPAKWDGAFGVVYSNAFDHCQDPKRTIAAWKRVVRPGGYLIFCYVWNQQVKATDPVGNLDAEDILPLLGGELIYFREGGSRNRYSEVVVQFNTV